MDLCENDQFICDSPSCNSNFYRSLHIYYLIGSSCSLCGSLFVILTYLFTSALRTHPSVLIFGRSVFDCGFALSFITLYVLAHTDKGLSNLICDGLSCRIMGPFNLFVFLCSQGYFLALLIDLYLSISNPFLNVPSYTKLMTLCIILFAGISVILVEICWRFEYNKDLEYCTIGSTKHYEDANIYKWFFIYGPTFCCMIFSFIVTFYAFTRLTTGLPNTFFIRLKALKDTLVYVIIFTIYFCSVGCAYFITWHKHIDENNDEAWFTFYAISSSLLGVIDFIVWVSRKGHKMFRLTNKHHSDSISPDLELLDNTRKLTKQVSIHPTSPDQIFNELSTDSENENENENEISNKWNGSQITQHNKKRFCKRLWSDFGIKQQNNTSKINKALRREIIAYTTDGIAQSILKAKELPNKTDNYNDIKSNYFPMNINDPNDQYRIRQFWISIKHNIALLNVQQTSWNQTFCGCFTMDAKRISLRRAKLVYRERLFTDYAPLIFRYIRNHIVGINDEDYISSIIPSNHEDQLKVLDVKCGEGKSGAFFYFSWDSKFIVKTVTKQEVKYLMSFLQCYVKHLENNRNTVLSRVVGIHSCRFYSIVKYFVVMENVFLGDLKPNEVYDLKGSWVGRMTKQRVGVMKDLNLQRYIVLTEKTRKKLIKQLEVDTKFLSDNNVMDYSLLLGIYNMKITYGSPQNNINQIDDESYTKYNEYLENGGDIYGGVRSALIEGPGIYYFGIIDAIQKYNFKKKLEAFFKVWIQRKNSKGISCVNPQLYRKRFIKYMKSIIISNEKYYQQLNLEINTMGNINVLIYPNHKLYYDSMKVVRDKRVNSIASYVEMDDDDDIDANLTNIVEEQPMNGNNRNENNGNGVNEVNGVNQVNGHERNAPKLHKCDQCFKSVSLKNGKLDHNDGFWYCNNCWHKFYD
eukprot:64867_1